MASHHQKINEKLFTAKMNKLLNSNRGGVSGLCNIGNTCYANAILQALLNNKSFRTFMLLDWNNEKHKNSHLLKNIRRLFEHYWSGNFVTIRPEEVIKIVQEDNVNFVPWEEHDSHEFFVSVLELLHDEVMSVDFEDIPSKGQSDVMVFLKRIYSSISQSEKKGNRDIKALLGFFGKTLPEEQEKNVENILQSLKASIAQKIDEIEKTLESAVNDEKTKKLKNHAENQKKENIAKVEDSGENSGEKWGEKSCEKPEKKEIKDKKIKNGENDVIIENLIKSFKWPESRREKRSSFIKDIFYGVFLGEVSCSECGRVSKTSCLFNNLPLEIPGGSPQGRLDGFWSALGVSGKTVSLYACLRHFCMKEGLAQDDMYFCAFCSKKVNASKRIYIEKPPETLVIQLKRFSHLKGVGSKKIVNTIDYPLENLDLADFMRAEDPAVCESSEQAEGAAPSTPTAHEGIMGGNDDCGAGETKQRMTAVYSLSAVVAHKGDLTSGHYIAYCKNAVTGQWREFNDRFVKTVSEKELAKKEAYMLFYERENDAKTIDRNQSFVEDVLWGGADCAEASEREAAGGRKAGPVVEMEMEGVERRKRGERGEPGASEKMALPLSAGEESDGEVLLSKQWLLKTAMFDCPGPVESRELLCRHGNVCLEAAKAGKLALKISRRQWGRLTGRFGSASATIASPPVREVEPCEHCAKDELQRRRKTEGNRVLAMEKSLAEKKWEKSVVTYLISESWMSRWRSFVNDESDVLPGPIFNEHLLNEEKKVLLDLKIEKDFRVVTKNVWDYLLGLYGGGPEIVNDFLCEEDLL